MTFNDGISSVPCSFAIKVQEIDLEEDLSPFINLYSLPIFGPEIIEKESSILDISIDGFLSTSEILIVKIIDSVIFIFLAETEDDIACAFIKPINEIMTKKILTILFHFRWRNCFVFAFYLLFHSLS